MFVRLRKITSKTGTKLLLLIFASSKWINSSSYICLVPLIHVQHHVKVKYLIFHISFSYFTVVLNLYYNPFYTEKTQKEFGEIKPCTEFSATNTLCTTIQHKIFMFFEMIKWKNCLLGLIFESARFIQFRGDACCGIQIF